MATAGDFVMATDTLVHLSWTSDLAQWRSEDHLGRRCSGAETARLLAFFKSKPLIELGSAE